MREEKNAGSGSRGWVGVRVHVCERERVCVSECVSDEERFFVHGSVCAVGVMQSLRVNMSNRESERVRDG